MKFDQIISDLKNKIYHPLYLLAGEEAFFIDEISNYIEENILDAGEKEFNQTVVYGKDTDVASIISYAKRFPMMANYQVVIVKEAQSIKNLDELIPYIEQPLKSTLLVICYKYKKIDKRKALVKKADKLGVFFESNKLYENKVPEWINQQLIKNNCTIQPKAAVILTEFLGTDLSKISNEINKLMINLPTGSEISPSHIEENIGISKDFNVFELQSALGKKNIYKANQIINYFASNQKDNPLIKVVGILYSFFSKLLVYHHLKDKNRNSVASALSVNPFFVQDYQVAARNYNADKLNRIISSLKEYDLKSKGVNNASATDGELMKELIFKILH